MGIIKEVHTHESVAQQVRAKSFPITSKDFVFCSYKDLSVHEDQSVV